MPRQVLPFWCRGAEIWVLKVSMALVVVSCARVPPTLLRNGSAISKSDRELPSRNAAGDYGMSTALVVTGMHAVVNSVRATNWGVCL